MWFVFVQIFVAFNRLQLHHRGTGGKGEQQHKTSLEVRTKRRKGRRFKTCVYIQTQNSVAGFTKEPTKHSCFFLGNGVHMKGLTRHAPRARNKFHVLNGVDRTGLTVRG